MIIIKLYKVIATYIIVIKRKQTFTFFDLTTTTTTEKEEMPCKMWKRRSRDRDKGERERERARWKSRRLVPVPPKKSWKVWSHVLELSVKKITCTRIWMYSKKKEKKNHILNYCILKATVFSFFFCFLRKKSNS